MSAGNRPPLFFAYNFGPFIGAYNGIRMRQIGPGDAWTNNACVNNDVDLIVEGMTARNVRQGAARYGLVGRALLPGLVTRT